MEGEGLVICGDGLTSPPITEPAMGTPLRSLVTALRSLGAPPVMALKSAPRSAGSSDFLNARAGTLGAGGAGGAGASDAEDSVATVGGRTMPPKIALAISARALRPMGSSSLL